MSQRATLVLAAVVALVAAAGCGGVNSATDSGKQRRVVVERPATRDSKKPAVKAVAPSHCQSGLPSCRTTEGWIAYVEKVDPDGDGDAHFVVLDSQSITLPGLTAIDVRKGLRPHPLPGVGDLVSAAGPIETGSYGQSQIHALEVHVADR